MITLGILAILLLVAAPICSYIACRIVDKALTKKQAEKSYIVKNLSYVFLTVGEILGVFYFIWYFS